MFHNDFSNITTIPSVSNECNQSNHQHCGKIQNVTTLNQSNPVH